MKNDRKELHKRIIADLLTLLAIVLFFIYIFPDIFVLCLPLIIAWIVALLSNPLIKFFESKFKMMRKHGSIVVILLVITLLAALIYLLIVLLINQAGTLKTDIRSLAADVHTGVNGLLSWLNSKSSIIPKNIDNVFDSSNSIISKFLKSFFSGSYNNSISFKRVARISSSVGDIFILTVLTIIASYFMTAEKENISTYFRKHMPEPVQNYWKMIRDIFNKAVVGYFVAHFKIMAVIFVVTTIPYIFLGVKHFILLGIITAVIDFLPIFGTGTILIPWAAYNLIKLKFGRAVVLVILYIVTVILRQSLEPKLVGDSVGMSSFATVVFMILGYRVGGMWGLILSIPIGMVLVIFYKNGIFDRHIKGLKILLHDFYEYIHFPVD